MCDHILDDHCDVHCFLAVCPDEDTHWTVDLPSSWMPVDQPVLQAMAASLNLRNLTDDNDDAGCWMTGDLHCWIELTDLEQHQLHLS